MGKTHLQQAKTTKPVKHVEEKETKGKKKHPQKLIPKKHPKDENTKITNAAKPSANPTKTTSTPTSKVAPKKK